MEQNTTTGINVYNLLIIDESGSMGRIYDQALSGINETLNTIRIAQEKYPLNHYFVSVVSFEGNGPAAVKFRRDREPISTVKDLTKEEYVPGGYTPLYDAIGISVNRLASAVKAEDSVIVTIITDGYENSSAEYSGTMVKEMISRRRSEGWTFAYIGANQDAVEVARGLNIGNAMRFEATPEGTVSMSLKYRRSLGRVMCYMAEAPGRVRDVDTLFDEEKDEKDDTPGVKGGITPDRQGFHGPDKDDTPEIKGGIARNLINRILHK